MLGISDVAHSPSSPNSVFHGKQCARTTSVANTLAKAPSRIQTWQPTERRLIDTNPLACVSPPRVPALLRASVFALTEQHKPPEEEHNLKTIRQLMEDERVYIPAVADNTAVDKEVARRVEMVSQLPREELVRLALNGFLTPTVAPLEGSGAGAGAGETSPPRSGGGSSTEIFVESNSNVNGQRTPARKGSPKKQWFTPRREVGQIVTHVVSANGFLTPQRGADGINTETACTSNLNGFLTPPRDGDLAKFFKEKHAGTITETACTSNNMKGFLTPQRKGINTVRTCNMSGDRSPQRGGSSGNIATNFNASGELKVYASERACVTPPRGDSSSSNTAAPNLKRKGPRRGRSNTIATTSNHGFRTPPKTPSRALQRVRTPFMLEVDAGNTTMEANADYSYQTPQRLSRAPLARLLKKSTSTQNILAFSVECLGELFSQALESFSTPERGNDAANTESVDEKLHTPARDLKSLLEPPRDERTPTQPMGRTEGVKGVPHRILF